MLKIFYASFSLLGMLFYKKLNKRVKKLKKKAFTLIFSFLFEF
mgnify:CR=1 FL=1